MKNYVEKMTALKEKKEQKQNKLKSCKKIETIATWTNVGLGILSICAGLFQFPVALSIIVLGALLTSVAGSITNGIITGKTRKEIMEISTSMNDLYVEYRKEQKVEENNLTQTLKTESTNTIAQEAVYTEEKTQDKQDEFTM